MFRGQCRALLRQYYGVLGPVGPGSPQMSERDEKMKNLAVNVFSYGNNFMKNATNLDGLPEMTWSMPEIAVIGTRNSGKTSLIRGVLANDKYTSLRVSGEPGTTQHLGFFNIGDCFSIVDTPGYGGVRPQKRGEAMLGLAMTKRYLRLRRSGALKMTYYCIGADGNITERDRDYLNFLKYENVPYTIVLTKIDALCGGGEFDPASVAVAGNRIFEAFGTDEVPMIEVSASRGWNIDSLRVDMVHHASSDLKELEDLSVEKMRELSYLPPTIEEKTEADLRFPVWAQALPRDDDMPMNAWLRIRQNVQENFLAKAGLTAVDVKEIDESKRFSPWTVSGVNSPTGVEQSTPAHHWSLPPPTEADPFQLEANERLPLDRIVEQQLGLPAGAATLRVPLPLSEDHSNNVDAQLSASTSALTASPSVEPTKTISTFEKHGSEKGKKKTVVRKVVRRIKKSDGSTALKPMVSTHESDSPNIHKAVPLDEIHLAGKHPPKTEATKAILDKDSSSTVMTFPAAKEEEGGVLPTPSPDISALTPETQIGPGMNGVELQEADRMRYVLHRPTAENYDSTEVQMVLEQNLADMYDPGNDHGVLERGKYMLTASMHPDMDESDVYAPHQVMGKHKALRQYYRQKYVLGNRKEGKVLISQAVAVNPLHDAGTISTSSILGSGTAVTTNRGGVMVPGLKEGKMLGKKFGTGVENTRVRNEKRYRKWARPNNRAPLPLSLTPHGGNKIHDKLLPKRFSKKSRTHEGAYFK